MLVGFLLMAGSGVNSQREREVWRSRVRASFWKVACVWVSLGGRFKSLRQNGVIASIGSLHYVSSIPSKTSELH